MAKIIFRTFAFVSRKTKLLCCESDIECKIIGIILVSLFLKVRIAFSWKPKPFNVYKINKFLTNGSSTLSELFPFEPFHEFLVKIPKQFVFWPKHMYPLHHPNNIQYRFYQSDKLNGAQSWTIHPKYSIRSCSIVEYPKKRLFFASKSTFYSDEINPNKTYNFRCNFDKLFNKIFSYDELWSLIDCYYWCRL